jgi:hypothetical protein
LLKVTPQFKKQNMSILSHAMGPNTYTSHCLGDVTSVTGVPEPLLMLCLKEGGDALLSPLTLWDSEYGSSRLYLTSLRRGHICPEIFRNFVNFSKRIPGQCLHNATFIHSFPNLSAMKSVSTMPATQSCPCA